MTARLLTLALIAVALMAAPAPAAPEDKIDRLERRVNRLLDKLWQTHRNARQVRLDRDFLYGELKRAQAANAQLRADNANLREGLPDAIRAVPLDQFWPMVFTPARETWPCDSYFQGSYGWSLTFDSSSYC
jgi:hypothetical protein